MIVVWSGALCYGLYRVYADSGKVVVGWRSVADELGLSIDGDDSRLAVAMQLSNYTPRLYGTYRGINIAVRVSSERTEAILDGKHVRSARHLDFEESSAHLQDVAPVTVFEASLGDSPPPQPSTRPRGVSEGQNSDHQLDGRDALGELQLQRPNVKLRDHSVAFWVDGLLDDPDEIIECIEDLVRPLERIS